MLQTSEDCCGLNDWQFAIIGATSLFCDLQVEHVRIPVIDQIIQS